MGILEFLTDIFQSIFMSSSPEVKKKQALHKIDSEIRNIQPCIYKSGMLQPNFAELFRILYENVKPLEDLLSETISSEDIKRNENYENQLLLTGFTGQNQEKLENLSVEARKQEVIDSDLPMTKVFEKQKHTLEFLIHELNSQEFARIDEVIGQLQQLTDICRFNYLTVIHRFDPEYNGFNPGYEPNFVSCVPSSFGTAFQDLYFVTANFKVTSALGRAIIALAQLRKRQELSETDANKYLGYLKKINTIFTKHLTPDVMKKLICLAKSDPDFVPQIASYKINARQKFAAFLQNKFISDETQIKNEIKDTRISLDLKKLFEGRPLCEMEGYNIENSRSIQVISSTGFTWITPLQITKTFLRDFYNEPIRALLEDIVIEGFFNIPSYKTDFSSIVYAAQESSSLLKKFEDNFGRGGKNDKAILDGYIQDSRKDADFVKKLTSSVDNINEEAHQLVQQVSASIYELYKHLSDLLVDAKKTKPDMISNLKVLLTSTRNRDNVAQLEQQFEYWGIYLSIMKNYAIIGEVDRK